MSPPTAADSWFVSESPDWGAWHHDECSTVNPFSHPEHSVRNTILVCLEQSVKVILIANHTGNHHLVIRYWIF